MDLPPGSEVVLPPITIQPMVDAVRSVGCRPVVVDIDPGTLLFDPEQLAQHLSERTRVVMITYLFGIASDPTPIIDAARAIGARVVEDFSHNLGASVHGRPVGTFGDVGIYSTSATKTLDTYGGGLAVTDDEELAAKLRRAQGQLRATPRSRLLAKVSGTLLWNVTSSRTAWTLATFPLVRWLRRRHPGVELAISGARKPPSGSTGPADPWFERFTAQQAAAGLELLPEVAATDRIRVANAEQIRATLRYLGVPVPAGSLGGQHVHWQCVAYIEDVERVQQGLAADGFDTAGTNLRLVCECEPSSCRHPVGRAVKRHALYLPCHPGVRASSLHRLTRSLTRLRPVASETLRSGPGPGATDPGGDRAT
jgi:dTDP-4-amino-4,6-dideoxygalactose transaminase